jgi:lauroyl/myristoyl acyltransferase
MRWITRQDLYYLAIIGLIRFTGRFPLLGLRAAVVSSLAAAAYHLSRRKRRLVERNLAACFGERLGPQARRKIAQGVFHETWREMFWGAELEASRSNAQIEVCGLEHVREALAAGRGAILWESHGLSRRLLAKKTLKAHGFPVHQVHGPNNLGGFLADQTTLSRVRQTVVRPFFDRREEHVVAEILYLPDTNSLSYTRDLLARLRQNALLCISGDGRLGQRHIDVPFLGRTAPFASGMISLARLSGAPLLPLFCLEVAPGHIRLTVEPPLRVEPGAGREAEAAISARYAALLEERIRSHPEQYRNWHLLAEAAQ